MSITHASDQSFSKLVNQPQLTLVDFWAPWCGPCRMLAPILDQLDREMGGEIQIIKVNVDENPMTAGQYRIMSIPTMKMFKNGVELSTVVGVHSLEQLKEMVKRLK